MATEKIPSIYDDRGTIGSSSELDQYGVWVKLEPQDFSSESELPFPGLILDNDEGEGDISFDDLSNSSLDEEFNLDEAETPFPDTARAANKPAADISTQLLMKIAEELSFIKTELSSLKNEISTIRNEWPVGASAEPIDGEGRFFDEEDDDKIALTGDELNNIIHNADFIEETGSDAGVNLSEDFGFPSSAESIDLSESEDLTPASEGLFELGDTPDISDDFSPEAYTGDTEQSEDPPAERVEGVIYDGLGRPLNMQSSGSGLYTEAVPEQPEEIPESAEESSDIIYDGLGRPLNREFSESEPVVADFPQEDFLELENSKDTEDLKILREGVEPMTPAPEDVSYLEEDPLVEELDLSDAIIDEPDLSEGILETPLEEPSLDNLSLIDLEDMSGIPAIEENLFEEVSFDDLSLDENSGEVSLEAVSPEADPDKGDFSEISFDDIPDPFVESSLDLPDSDLNFEMIGEDADLPIQGNVQDNVITDDSFESISLFDEGEKASDKTPGDEPQIDDDLEQSLPEGMKIELDLPPLDLPLDEIDEFFKEAGLDDLNFRGPGAAENADAGVLTDDNKLPEDLDSLEITLEDDSSEALLAAPTLVGKFPAQEGEDDASALDIPEEASMEIPFPGETEIPSSIKNELRNVLIYMDKLLESLPEKKIEEFAGSEYFNLYKKLFEELGIG